MSKKWKDELDKERQEKASGSTDQQKVLETLKSEHEFLIENMVKDFDLQKSQLEQEKQELINNMTKDFELERENFEKQKS